MLDEAIHKIMYMVSMSHMDCHAYGSQRRVVLNNYLRIIKAVGSFLNESKEKQIYHQFHILCSVKVLVAQYYTHYNNNSNNDAAAYPRVYNPKYHR